MCKMRCGSLGVCVSNEFVGILRFCRLVVVVFIRSARGRSIIRFGRDWASLEGVTRRSLRRGVQSFTDEGGKKQGAGGVRKRSRAQFLVVVDQSGRPQSKNVYLRKSAVPRPRRSELSHSTRFFTFRCRRDYCACVVWSRQFVAVKRIPWHQ